MNLSDLFPSRYLKSTDMNGHAMTLEMSHINKEDVGMLGNPQVKPVLYFEGREKGLVLNKTNARSIANRYSEDTNEWKGHLVELFPTTTEFQGKTVDCIRVRIPVPAADSVSDEIPF